MAHADTWKTVASLAQMYNNQGKQKEAGELNLQVIESINNAQVLD
jgi:hypothetical protein